MKEFHGRKWIIESFGEPTEGAPLIILLAGEDELSSEFREKLSAEGVPPLWIAVPCEVDWERDFTPWYVEGTNGRVFYGGADAFGEHVASVREALQQELYPEKTYIVGYSLGGLAAMYLHTKLDFDGCGSCSGSLWYPGWCEYLEEHPPKGKVYLSLGGKEKNTRDPLMVKNPETTERTKQISKRSADAVIFKNEPGSHFKDPDGRLARAIKWLTSTV